MYWLFVSFLYRPTSEKSYNTSQQFIRSYVFVSTHKYIRIEILVFRICWKCLSKSHQFGKEIHENEYTLETAPTAKVAWQLWSNLWGKISQTIAKCLAIFIALFITCLLLQYYQNRSCGRCNKVPKDPLICLMCGKMVCKEENCCKQSIGNRGKKYPSIYPTCFWKLISIMFADF